MVGVLAAEQNVLCEAESAQRPQMQMKSEDEEAEEKLGECPSELSRLGKEQKTDDEHRASKL